MARMKISQEEAEDLFRKHPYGQKQYDREIGPERPAESERPRKSTMDIIKERAGQELEYYTGVKPATVSRVAKNVSRFGHAMGEAVEAVGSSQGAREVRGFAQRMNDSDSLGGGFGGPGIMQNSSMNPKKKIYEKPQGHWAPRTIRDVLGEDRGL